MPNNGTSGRIQRIRSIAKRRGHSRAAVNAIAAYWKRAWKTDPALAGRLMNDAHAAVKQAITSIEWQRTQGNAANWDRKAIAGGGLPSRLQEPRREGSARRKATMLQTTGRNGKHFNEGITARMRRPSRRGTR